MTDTQTFQMKDYKVRMHRMALRAAQEALGCLERAILCTPTGPDRDELTQANIHLMSALDKMNPKDDQPLAG